MSGTLPHELLAAILAEIDDFRTLKNCSLASTALRDPSQRLLLRSLTLGGDEPKYAAAAALLRTSPHVAAYFTTLSFLLPAAVAPSDDTDSLREVLPKLTNVRICYILGTIGGLRPWHEVPAPLAASLFAFLHRAPLAQLHIIAFAALPTDILCAFLSTAPTLSFLGVAAAADTNPEIADAPSSLGVQNLLLTACSTVVDALTSPALSARLPNLRAICADPDLEYGHRMLSAFAHQLQHIELERSGIDFRREAASAPPAPLPPMPLLRSANLAIAFDPRETPHLIARISSLLFHNPPNLYLQHLRIACSDIQRWPVDPYMEPATIAALDALLADSSLRTVRWALHVLPKHVGEFAAFANGMERGMPRFTGEDRGGRLVVERWEVVRELGDWVGVAAKYM
ncbi:hypothetical protein C8R46DRAFT_1346901 [Mycena filopes]|nr:hypothetical protein C8R46DRAFT_1346901 [Mycena filopes]